MATTTIDLISHAVLPVDVKEHISDLGYASILGVPTTSFEDFHRSIQNKEGCKAKNLVGIYRKIAYYQPFIKKELRKYEKSFDPLLGKFAQTGLSGDASINHNMWTIYTDPGYIQSCLSPAAYLAYLWNLKKSVDDFYDDVEDYAYQKIETRRPDLLDFTLSEEALNNELPTIEIGNEILKDNLVDDQGCGFKIETTIPPFVHNNISEFDYFTTIRKASSSSIVVNLGLLLNDKHIDGIGNIIEYKLDDGGYTSLVESDFGDQPVQYFFTDFTISTDDFVDGEPTGLTIQVNSNDGNFLGTITITKEVPLPDVIFHDQSNALPHNTYLSKVRTGLSTVGTSVNNIVNAEGKRFPAAEDFLHNVDYLETVGIINEELPLLETITTDSPDYTNVLDTEFNIEDGSVMKMYEHLYGWSGLHLDAPTLNDLKEYQPRCYYNNVTNFLGAQDISYDELRALIRDYGVHDESDNAISREGAYATRLGQGLYLKNWNVETILAVDGVVDDNGGFPVAAYSDRGFPLASTFEAMSTMIRLCKRSGLTFADYDYLLNCYAACVDNDFAANIFDDSLSFIAEYLWWKEHYGLSVNDMVGMIKELNPYIREDIADDQSQYGELFGSASQTVFENLDVSPGSDDNLSLLYTVLSGLDLTVRDYEMIKSLYEDIEFASFSDLLVVCFRCSKLFSLMGVFVETGLQILSGVSNGANSLAYDLINESTDNAGVLSKLVSHFNKAEWLFKLFTDNKLDQEDILTVLNDSYQKNYSEEDVNWVKEVNSTLQPLRLNKSSFSAYTGSVDLLEGLSDGKILDANGYGIVLNDNSEDINTAIEEITAIEGITSLGETEVAPLTDIVIAAYNNQLALIPELLVNYDSTITSNTGKALAVYMGATTPQFLVDVTLGYAADPDYTATLDELNQENQLTALKAHLNTLTKTLCLFGSLTLTDYELIFLGTNTGNGENYWLNRQPDDESEAANNLTLIEDVINLRSLIRSGFSLDQWTSFIALIKESIEYAAGISQDQRIAIALGLMLQWMPDDVIEIIADTSDTSLEDDGAYESGIHGLDFDFIVRVKAIIESLRAHGLSYGEYSLIKNTATAAALDAYQEAASSIDLVVRRKSEDSYEQYHRACLEIERDTLLNYFSTANYEATQLNGSLISREDIYQYLLIDVNVSSDVPTTRLLEAIGSVQMYINMALTYDRLEDATLVSEWQAASHYRVWEANKKLEMYPEDYIEPELRFKKSEIFSKFESAINDGTLSETTVGQAIGAYVSNLAKLAELKVTGWYKEANGDNEVTYHIIAKAPWNEKEYFYRKVKIADLDALGQPSIDTVYDAVDYGLWESITIPFTSDKSSNAVPFFAWGNFYVAWVESMTENVEASTPGETINNLVFSYSRRNITGDFTSPSTIVVAADLTFETGQTFEKNVFVNQAIKENNAIDGTLSNINNEVIRILVSFDVNAVNASFVTISYDQPVSVMVDNSNITVDATMEGNYKIIANNQGFSYAGLSENSGNITSIHSKRYEWKHGLNKRWDQVGISSDKLNIDFAVYRDGNGKHLAITMQKPAILFYRESTSSTKKRRNAQIKYTKMEVQLKINGTTLVSMFSSGASQGDGGWILTENAGIGTGSGDLIEDFSPTPGSDITLVEEAADGLYRGTCDLSTGEASAETFIISGQLVISEFQLRCNEKHTDHSAGQKTTITRGFNFNGDSEITATFSATKGVEYGDRVYVNSQGYDQYLRSSIDTGDTTFLKLDSDATRKLPTKFKGLDPATIFTLSNQSLKEIPDREVKEAANAGAAGAIVSPNSELYMHFSGAYGRYLWELFYHMPMLLAVTYNKSGEYEKSFEWLSKIYTPTENMKWRCRPLMDSVVQGVPGGVSKLFQGSGKEIVDVDEIAESDPFYYRLATVRHYIDNNLDYGDAYYRMETVEDIRIAKQRYSMGLDLFGDPNLDNIMAPFKERSWRNVPLAFASDYWDEEEGENQESTTNEDNPKKVFLPPYSQTYQGLLARNENRLYNTRHWLDINGNPLHIPLIEPPINPRALQLAGLNSMSYEEWKSAYGVLPNYRYTTMVEKARQFVSTLMDLGTRLQTAFENKDGVQQAKISRVNEMDLLRLSVNIQKEQVNMAQTSLKTLDYSYDSAEGRYNTYAAYYDENGCGRSDTEIAMLVTNQILSATVSALQLTDSIGKMLKTMPTIFGLSNGGFDPEAPVQSGLLIAATGVTALQTQLTAASQVNDWDRRRADWKLNRDQARIDMDSINVQKQIANLSLDNEKSKLAQLETQLDQEEALLDWMKNKFTNANYYEWLRNRLSGFYKITFDAAVDICHKAEQALQYELCDFDTRFINPVWNERYKGLLAGESLLMNLNAMDNSYMTRNSRRLEIVKQIPLMSVGAIEAVTSTNSFELTLEYFSADRQNVYQRQIKLVEISIPALVGPYEGISATLTQTESTLYIDEDENEEYPLQKSGDTIALSTCVADSGMFQLGYWSDMNDSRYLPFEGTGVNSHWILEFEGAFEPSKIQEIIMTVYYTAKSK